METTYHNRLNAEADLKMQVFIPRQAFKRLAKDVILLMNFFIWGNKVILHKTCFYVNMQ